jgi:formate hydrogenlyase subunit 3/multisubunit Na+/H+ antiporter MnhD subunit
MGPLSRLALPVLALVAACLIAIDSVRQPGVTFRIAVLSGMAIINLAILVSSPAVMIFLAELGMLVLVWPIREGTHRSSRDIIGYAALMTFAMPCCLLAAWLLGLLVANPAQMGVLEAAIALLALGLGVMLALVPLHGWWPVLAEAMSPALAVLVGVAFPVVGLTILADLAVRNPLLVAAPLARQTLVIGGMLSVIGGALLALTAGGLPADRPRRLLPAAAIHDLGAVILGIGLVSAEGTAGAMLDLSGRVLALVLLAAALEGLQCARVGQGGRRAGEVAVAGVIFAGLSLGGIPLTGTFPGRWLILRLTFDANPALGVILLASGGLVALSFLELLRQDMVFPAAGSRPSPLSIGVVGLIVLSIALGLWPQWLLDAMLNNLALVTGGG